MRLDDDAWLQRTVSTPLQPTWGRKKQDMLTAMTTSSKLIDDIWVCQHYRLRHEGELDIRWTSWIIYGFGLYDVRLQVEYEYSERKYMPATNRCLGPWRSSTYLHYSPLSMTNSEFGVLEYNFVVEAKHDVYAGQLICSNKLFILRQILTIVVITVSLK